MLINKRAFTILCGSLVPFIWRRRCFYCIILATVLLPVFKLLWEYGDEIWYFCPQINFKWGGETLKAKCEIPQLNLWDSTILKYVTADEPVADCVKDYPLLRLSWSSNSKSVLELTENGKKELLHLFCIYQLITRNQDDKTVEYGEEQQAVFPLEMPGELVQITCREKEGGATFYTDTFAAILPVKRITNSNQKPLSGSELAKKWNIMVIGIDSVSRQSFIRFLPKAFKWLTSNKENGIHVFDAYHKLGENTFPNLVPMLTGRKVELSSPKETLQLPHSGGTHTWVLGLPFDDFPFIWKEFASTGYATGYVEDDPKIGTFQLVRRGFKEQPTDHYGFPLFIAWENLRGKEDKLNPGLLNMFNKSKDGNLIEDNFFCINGRKKYEVFWDYAVKQFVSRYSNLAPNFMFTWENTLTHNWLTTLKQADDFLLGLLKLLTEDKGTPWRNNTFVLLLSDHGQRADKIRSTFVGRLEERLPFLAVSIPPAFRKKYPKFSANLAGNTKRLMTALDIYATFKHILHLSTVAEDKAIDFTGDVFEDVGPSGYAVSLFNPINPQRSCDEAGIPEWFCACHRYVKLNTTSSEAVEASKAMAKAINDDLEEAKEFCAPLTLAKIEQIRRVEFAKGATTYTKKCRFFGIIKEADDVEDAFTEYVVQITMQPSNGKFEATIRNNWRTGDGWQMVGLAERVNRYGNQSACLPDSLGRLRTSCFCPSAIPSPS